MFIRRRHHLTGTHPRAFTLIELLVVMAIISILLSILTVSLRRVRGSSRRVVCAHNLKQVSLAMEMYLSAHDTTYPCAQDPVSTNPPYWLWMGRGWRQWIKPYLDDSIDANNPSVLLCPEDRTDPAKYESTSYDYSMTFYHSSDQIDTLNDKTQTYSNPLPAVPQRSGDVAYPAAKILIGEWFSNHVPVDQEQGWWNWQGTRNFLCADGQVLFLPADKIRPARDGLPDANLTLHGIKGRDHTP